MLLATQGDLRGALEHFDKAAAIAPANAEFAGNLARAKAAIAEQSAATGSLLPRPAIRK